MKIKYLFILAMCWISNLETASVSAQTVTVDLSSEFQIIRGFGGMNHTTWIKDLNEDNREKAFGNDPGEMGLSILRMHVNPNAAQFNLEVPTALHAIKKGAVVFATPWNAPEALTVKVSDITKVDPAKYDAYAAHLNAFDTYMSNNGAPLYAISVQNEPDWGEWTRWTSAEMLDFLKNHAHNLNNPRVMAPESFQFRRAFSDPLLNDAKAAANFEIVGGHIYGGGLADYPLARQKGKEVWMTEHLLGSGDGLVNNWDLALTVGKEINDCMKANFNAYVWWYIRRSYGLITDDGNITDKGYVISQFSKFIRPGAVRVDATITSSSLLDVTAYKTDTSFVMVVVNRNSTGKSLNFNIKNGTVDKLTQFTTSATKKGVNDGDLTVSGGLFTATVDAKSVTTFTTYSANGGKTGNVKPTAFAGDDLIINDTGTGSNVIKLDGSLSEDSDGEIVNYSWSLNEQQIAWEPNAESTISIGEYNYVLTVTDNDGATATDTLHVKFKSLNNTEIWLEAECATIGANWDTNTDAGASNGSYVMAKPGIQSLTTAAGSEGTLVLPFSVDTTGNYNLHARLNCPTSDDDSFWIKLDNGSFTTFNGLVTNGWAWLKLTSFWLTKGQHKLTITYREDGAKLDKILIANTGLIPTAFGGAADNCELNTGNIKSLYDNEGIFTVYPNPSSGQVNISWDKKFNSLKVYNLQGQSLLVKQYPAEIEKTDEVFDFGQGIYFIMLQNKNSSAVKKIVIN
ncbi:MAG: T9SS type A sorting domain-containing protein [Prolixibacteraceae bacterium]|nr:T9SS type A sorting domain-containing protein [Prolixibacteraceae bacterium]